MKNITTQHRVHPQKHTICNFLEKGSFFKKKKEQKKRYAYIQKFGFCIPLMLNQIILQQWEKQNRPSFFFLMPASVYGTVYYSSWSR